MNNQKNEYEIIKFEDGEFSLDVNVSPTEETVWLTQNEIAQLFGVDRTRITRHISNILHSKELNYLVCAENARTATDGKTYIVKHYNLDMILAVGYRVNSKIGILFRKWASSILKQYMLKGYSVNEKRCLDCQDNIISLNNKVNTLIEHDIHHAQMIKNLSNINNITREKLFYEDEIYDAYSYIKQLFLSAKSSIILVDGYIDLSVLDMLVDVSVPITIYTFPSSSLTKQDIHTFNIKHNLEVIQTTLVHDRFIIIDNTIYLCGSSIKDVGKKRFVLTKLDSIKIEDILKSIISTKR